jgi:hypothetical protein
MPCVFDGAAYRVVIVTSVRVPLNERANHASERARRPGAFASGTLTLGTGKSDTPTDDACS